MIKKISVICIVFALISSMILNVYAFEEDSFEIHKMSENKYQSGIAWVKHYYPSGYGGVYKNVLVVFKGGAANPPVETATTFYIIYYKDGTTISAGSATTFSEDVLITTANSIADVEAILFENADGSYDFEKTSTGPTWTATWLYTDENFKGYYSYAQTSIGAYYSDYFYNKYGYNPYTLEATVNFMSNAEYVADSYTFYPIAGDSFIIADIIALAGGLPDGYEFEVADIWGMEYSADATYTFTENTTVNVFVKKAGADLSEIGEMLKNITQFFKDYASGEHFKILYESLANILPNAKDKINQTLTNNQFYVSATAIKDTLTDLFNDDYTDAEGFYELNIFNLTLGTPTTKYYKNYGNQTIGDWEVVVREEALTMGGVEVNFGLDNVKILNLDWFFDKHYEDGTYTKGVKTTITDPFISAVLWVAFAVWLWKTMPEWISGEIREISTLSVGIVNYEKQIKEKQIKKNEKEKNK